jgi:hypothetical protein
MPAPTTAHRSSRAAWLWLLVAVFVLAPSLTAKAAPPDASAPLDPAASASPLLQSPSASKRAGFDVRALVLGPPGGALVPTPSTPPREDDDEQDEQDEQDEVVPEQPRGRVEVPGELVVPTLEAKRVIPPFWVYRKFDTHTTRALTFPLVFVHRKPAAGHPEKFFHADLSFTFGYYAKQRGKTRWMNPLALFFYGKSEFKTSWAALPLLMGFRRVGDQYNFGQFPFVWWWGNKYVKNLVVLPFHYHKRAPDQRFAISGLLFWYGNSHLDDEFADNDRRHFVAAPVFWRFQKGQRSFDISPLWIAGRNDLKGSKHRTLLPFFHWQSRELGNRTELWTLAWIDRKDQARHKRAWAVPPLLTFQISNPRRKLLMATPLVWQRYDVLHDRRTTVALLGGAISDPQQHVSWVAPLWWRFADRRTQGEVGMLLPFAAWKRSSERFGIHTLALSVWRNRAAHARGPGGGAGSLPLLTFVHHDAVRSRQFVLGGVFWRFADRSATSSRWQGTGKSSWGVGPLVFRTKRGDSRASFGALPLLTFVGRNHDRSWQVVTPLFWHLRKRSDDPRLAHDTFVVPPFYFQKRAPVDGKPGFRTGLVPLFVAGNDERRRYAVVPFALFGHVYERESGISRTIFPLFVHAKGPKLRVVGAGVIGWHVERELDGKPARDTLVFPLYYRRSRGDTTLHLSPLGGAKVGPDGTTGVGLLGYGFRKQHVRGGGFAPLFHHEVRGEGHAAGVGSTTVLFPLFLRDRRPERDLDVWTPLVWRGRVRGELPRNSLAVVPFYFGQRQPGGVDVDASLFVVWARNPTRRTHTLVAGPYFHRLTRKHLTAGLAPLAFWRDSSKQRLLVVLPLIFNVEKKDTRERTTVALPLWFDRIQPSGRRVWMAFPFVVATYGARDFTKAGLAVPLFYDIFRLRKNFRFTGVVPLLFRYQKKGFQFDDDPKDRYTLWGSFPLFFYGRDGHGRVSHSALGLYWSDRSKDGFRFYTLLAGVQQRPGKMLEWYAPLVYRKVTNEQHTTFIWPIFAWHKGYRKGANGKPYKDISTTWVLPPLYVGRHKEDRSWWQSTLLVWQFKRPHKVSTAIAPPLFFLQDSYQERRLHWLLPLYLRDNNMAKRETWTTVIPGLYVAHRNTKHSRAVQFPLVWHFDEYDKRRVTIGGFLWYDIRLPRKQTATQVLPGLYARRETTKKVGHMIGPGLATWRREAEGQPPALHWRALLWIIGGGNEAGQRYLWLFGAKIELPPKPLAPRKIKSRKRKASDERTTRQTSEPITRRSARSTRG